MNLFPLLVFFSYVLQHLAANKICSQAFSKAFSEGKMRGEVGRVDLSEVSAIHVKAALLVGEKVASDHPEVAASYNGCSAHRFHNQTKRFENHAYKIILIDLQPVLRKLNLKSYLLFAVRFIAPSDCGADSRCKSHPRVAVCAVAGSVAGAGPAAGCAGLNHHHYQ